MKYAEMMKKALEMLNDDGELFVEMVNELDAWNGFADGFRAYPMYELDDLFCDCKVSDFLNKLADGFDLHDEYMVDTIYGLDSTDDVETLYRDNVDSGELLDEIIDKYNHLYFYNDDFKDLIENIVNYDDETKNNLILDAMHDVVKGVADVVQDVASVPVNPDLVKA